uniref:Cytohesin 1, 2, 3, putative n=1 Tax=Ixodes scapularis TaxID=6945 RepID=A0A1S4LC97_IXOSC
MLSSKMILPGRSSPDEQFSLLCRADLTHEEQQLLAEIRQRKTELLREIQQLKDEIEEVTAEMERLEAQEDGGSRTSTKAKQLSIGKKKFNMDPKKGIEYLVEHGLLRPDAAHEVAQFLYKGQGLNKTAIGDYLGERNDFNMRVLDAFVELHDFTDLILVQALRQFLWSFRLPGEAQKIDRMMEKFAQRYCQLNPGVFSNTDTCYVLSFAVIMLNTSLHNPSVRDKPSVEQFVSMNRGINNGGDLPRELLASLYDSIRQEPFKIPEDDGNDLMHTFFNPDREGWLWKQGGRYKSWKRRWFILNDNCLYYFEYTTDKEPRGIIPLENVQVKEVQDRHKPNCFELFSVANELIKACKTDSEGKVVEGKHTVYRMSAASPEEKDHWIHCLRQSISHNPFYDMLSARKKKAQYYNLK